MAESSVGLAVNSLSSSNEIEDNNVLESRPFTPRTTLDEYVHSSETEEGEDDEGEIPPEILASQFHVCPTVVASKMKRIATGKKLNGNQDLRAVAWVCAAAEEYLKGLLAKSAHVALCRMDPLRDEENFERCCDVKAQMKFLRELEEERKRCREEAAKEKVLSAAKAKTKSSKKNMLLTEEEEEEATRLKEMAKALQTEEKEKEKMREANATVWMAFSTKRKKPSFLQSLLERQMKDGGDPDLEDQEISKEEKGQRGEEEDACQQPALPVHEPVVVTKRVCLRDALYVFERDKRLRKSMKLYAVLNKARKE